MANEWTNAQRSAIEERNKTLLVSAAAGSGKTAVLTERIIQTVTDTEKPTEITDLLIVTFTRAAAGEMRKRIAKALNVALSEHPGNTHLTKQMMLLGSAHISTIDSFYLDLVKANFEAAGFPPAFRLADDAELYTLRRELMNEAIDRMYANEANFGHLADVFADARNEGSLTEQLITIRERLVKHPRSIDLLLDSAKEQERISKDPFHTSSGAWIYGELRRYAEAGIVFCGNVLEMLPQEPKAAGLIPRYEPLFRELFERCRSLLEAITAENADAVAACLSAPFEHHPQRGGVAKRTPEFVQAVKAASVFREKFLDMSEKCSGFTAKEIDEGSKEAAMLLRLLHRLLTDFETAYTATKKEREVAEFADISRAAFRLLVAPDGSPTALATSLSDSYAGIYIDEYQDVDAMQDATFRAISTPRNRFMVGDIKQSIYRFRGAEPAVFAGYKKSLPPLAEAGEADAASVFMSDCFRCDENVIRFSNAVFSPLFMQCRESIGYTAADDLCFRKKKPSADYLSPKCRLMLLNAKKEKQQTAGEENEPEETALALDEAGMIVDEIKRLLREEKKADGTPITPGDIAVLSRSTSFSKNISLLLTEAGISVNDTAKTLFFENPDVLCMFSLLSVIDNPLRDIHLASVLRSPFFSFTLSDLVSIRNGADRSLSLFEATELVAAQNTPLGNRCKNFLTKLETYRAKATILSVDKLLRYLYRDTAVLAFAAGTKKNEGIRRNANLLRLYEYARSFESTGFKGLYAFIRYVEDIMSSGAELPSPDGPRNAVSLVTIHHSKGLEFPVCFVAGAGKRFNQRDLIPPLLCDNDLGCGIRVPNAGVFSRANTFGRMAVSLAIKQKNIEEEMRVLYVAMTRARERLYVTASANLETLDDRVTLAASSESDFFARGSNSYIEWILTALEGTDYSDFLEITHADTTDTLDTVVESSETPFTAAENPVRVAELRQKLRERFAFDYPHAHLTQLPAKLSVSRLSPEVLDVYDTAETATEADLASPDAERLLHTFEKEPQFGKKERHFTAAERGTATHEFLQFCNWESACEKGVDAELDRLIEARFLPPEAAEAVRRDELSKFFESDLYREIKGAKNLRRETRFNIFLPAALFTADETLKARLGEETLLVQGVIDLFFVNEKGELVLCDYKTDRLTDSELRDPILAAKTLFDRHGPQLSYYKEALLRLCGKYPDKTLIYSLPLGIALKEP